MSENLIHQRLGRNNSGYARQLPGPERGRLKSVLRDKAGKVSNTTVSVLLRQSPLSGSLEEHQLVNKKAMDTEHPGKGSFPTGR